VTQQFPPLKPAKARAKPLSAAELRTAQVTTTKTAKSKAKAAEFAEPAPIGKLQRQPVNPKLAETAAPTISIILPVYNGATYLALALESILAQSYRDFELICVDDCSTDETPALLAEYAQRDPRVRIIRNPHNLKLPASLNQGFRAARGAWFTWTSDDNVLRPNMLARLMEIAQGNSGYDIFHADFTEIDADGQEGRRITVDPADELILGNAIGACFLYRRCVDTALGGYDETLFGVEDYDFWLRASRQFRFYQVHEDLYCYRRHDASLTSARARSIHAMAARIMERELHLLPPGKKRAHAWINLMCRDSFDLRFRLMFSALADDPAMFLASLPRIIRWFLYSMKQRVVNRSR
jgi:glycosyltransferase involved in cell wall biosynthesis